MSKEIFKQLHRELAIPENYWRASDEKYAAPPHVLSTVKRRVIQQLCELGEIPGDQRSDLLHALCARLAIARANEPPNSPKPRLEQAMGPKVARKREMIREFLEMRPLSTIAEIVKALNLAPAFVREHTVASQERRKEGFATCRVLREHKEGFRQP